jgi:hypothetical protein
MAESYFELLTEHKELPAKPFDSLGELKHLRRMLASRMHHPEVCDETGFFSCPEEAETNSAPFAEPISLAMVREKVNSIKKALAVWHCSYSRSRVRVPRGGIFRSSWARRNKKHVPSVVARYIEPPQEETLERMNTALMALGIVGVIFGMLNFHFGGVGSVPLDSLIGTTGAVIVAIGCGGRFLASHTDFLSGILPQEQSQERRAFAHQ